MTQPTRSPGSTVGKLAQHPRSLGSTTMKSAQHQSGVFMFMHACAHTYVHPSVCEMPAYDIDTHNATSKSPCLGSLFPLDPSSNQACHNTTNMSLAVHLGRGRTTTAPLAGRLWMRLHYSHANSRTVVDAAASPPWRCQDSRDLRLQ